MAPELLGGIRHDTTESPSRPEQSAEDGDSEAQGRWRSLFAFTNRSDLAHVVAGLVTATVSGLAPPIFAYLLGSVFDDFTRFGAGMLAPSELRYRVRRKIIYIIGVGGTSIVLNAAFYFVWMLHGDRQARTVRERLFHCVKTKSSAWCDIQAAGVAAALHTMQKHTRELQAATSQPLGFLMQHVVTGLAAIGLAFWNSWKLTLVVLSTLPVGLTGLAYLSRKVQDAVSDHADELARATYQAKSTMDTIEVVKSFNAQHQVASDYFAHVRSAARFYRVQVRWHANQIGWVRLFVRSLFVQGFWYGGHLVRSGNRTPGQVLTAFWGCLMATQTLEQILPYLMILETGKAAGARIHDFIESDDPEQDQSQDPGYRPSHCEGRVSIRNVKFAYPSCPGLLSLFSISMDFPAGQTTFVVGRSGSGKSTLAELLMRFYCEWKGEISIDGNPIDLLDLRWLRQTITLVSQDSVLLDETILRNIAFGKGEQETISRNLLDDSIDVASLSEVVKSLPDGLSTVVGAGSSTSLSGGQVQRIAIARARVKDSPILILDEATSALDQNTAVTVMGRIMRWRKGRTTVVITHNLGQVGPRDTLYVLDKGRVVEHGTRQKLEASSSSSTLFKDLVRSAGGKATSLRGRNRSQTGAERRLHSKSRSRPADLSTRSKHQLETSANDRELRSQKSFAQSERSLASRQSVRSRKSTLSLLRRGSVRLAFPAVGMSSGYMTGNVPNSPMSMSVPLALDDRMPRSPAPTQPSSPLINVAGRLARLSRLLTQKTGQPLESIGRPAQDIEMSVTTIAGAAQGVGGVHGGQENTTRGDESLSAIQILRTVWPRLNAKLRTFCCLGFVSAGLHAACTPLFSWIFAQLLATFYQRQGGEVAALRLSMALLALSFADSLSSFAMHFFLEAAAQAWVDDVRLDAFTCILDRPKSWFEEKQSHIVNVVEHLDRGAEEMRALLGRMCGYIVVAIVMLIIGLAWAMVITWKVTLVGISTAPAMYMLTTAYGTISTKWETRFNHACLTAFGVVMEVSSKLKTVRAFGLEGYFEKKHTNASTKAYRTGLKRGASSCMIFGLSDASLYFISALIFWYGSTLVASREIGVTAMMTVFSMLLFVVSNVNAILSFMPQVSSARSTATSLLAIIAQTSLVENEEHSGDTWLTELVGSIWLRNVRFQYASRPDHNALDGVTFELPRHKAVGLVGPSGSGKSTIVALILRLHSLRSGSGSIKVGDIPLSQLDSRAWRSLIAYVPQRPDIFPGSFADNITFGLASRSPLRRNALIRNAAACAGIDEFINSLPERYDTLIGEGGMGLSGGQKQKLAIARALIRRPKLLILDEPTSALDASSAEAIRSILRGLVEVDMMTVLVVTHSVEMMKSMDRLVLLDEGKVVEQGSYESLTSRSSEHLSRLLGSAWSSGR